MKYVCSVQESFTPNAIHDCYAKERKRMRIETKPYDDLANHVLLCLFSALAYEPRTYVYVDGKV